MSENPVSCVVLTVHNSKLFNSVDEIANLFLELYGKKELFVPVPSDLAIGIISGKMEELASSVDVGVQMKVEDFTNLAANGEQYSELMGPPLDRSWNFEKSNQTTQVLTINEPRSGEVPTIAVLSVMLVTDSAGQPVVELECMPKMMMLRTLAEPTDPNQEAYDPLYFTPTSGSVMRYVRARDAVQAYN
uniref:Uncharacterized protein n=1 Tax=Phytophthora ramorum TaxID=164328 RepID=H3HDH4_PHYRM